MSNPKNLSSNTCDFLLGIWWSRMSQSGNFLIFTLVDETVSLQGVGWHQTILLVQQLNCKYFLWVKKTNELNSIPFKNKIPTSASASKKTAWNSFSLAFERSPWMVKGTPRSLAWSPESWWPDALACCSWLSPLFGGAMHQNLNNKTATKI